MLKKSITYTDFDGDEQTEVFHFNLSKPEIIRLEVKYKKGYAEMLQSVIDSKDNKRILETFEELILDSYGVKSEDGKTFEKSDDLKRTFRHHAAYDALLEEFMTANSSADVLGDFVNGIFPREMAEAAAKEGLKNKTAEAMSTKDISTLTTAEISAQQTQEG